MPASLKSQLRRRVWPRVSSVGVAFSATRLHIIGAAAASGHLQKNLAAGGARAGAAPRRLLTMAVGVMAAAVSARKYVMKM